MANEQIRYIEITDSQYASLATKVAGAIYRTSDTHRWFVGADEYTKGTKVISAVPTEATAGEAEALYFCTANNIIYLCEGAGASTGTYSWRQVTGLGAGSVTSVAAGEGLETDQTGGAAITDTGTISHSVPSGAAVTTDPLSDQTPTFGGTFNVAGVATDKFGHVTAETTHTVTLPSETAVSVTDTTGTAQTLDYGDTFTVISAVDKGTGSHELEAEATTFTLPAAPQDLTYTFTTATNTEGAITVTPSQGSAYDVVISNYADLAKKTDITAVFKFKGTVATASALPTTGDVGDVYHVTEANAEYVCVQASTTDPQADAVWEELGGEIDLSAYALRADVIGRVNNATGEVAEFTSDGQLQSTGFTLGCSVPSDAVFTDTTYAPATTAADGLMSAADKTKLDALQLYWETYTPS